MVPTTETVRNLKEGPGYPNQRKDPRTWKKGKGFTHPCNPFISLRSRRGMDILSQTSKPFLSPNSKDNDQPRKMILTPLSTNNSGTSRRSGVVVLPMAFGPEADS